MTKHRPESRGIRAGVRRLFHLPVRGASMARADADAELDAYVDTRVEHFIARGMTPGQARAEALHRLSGPLSDVRATLRDSAERREGRKQWRDWVIDVWQDVRYAARGLARRPRFAVAAILCLGIGIGANATMFGVVDALLFRPPSAVRDPGSLVWINVMGPGFDGSIEEWSGVSYPDYLDFARSSALAGATVSGGGDSKFGRGTDARRINTRFINHTFMPLLGASPALGRFFTADADLAGGPPVVVLGNAFWQSQFAGAADIIGRTGDWRRDARCRAVGQLCPGVPCDTHRSDGGVARTLNGSARLTLCAA